MVLCIAHALSRHCGRTLRLNIGRRIGCARRLNIGGLSGRVLCLLRSDCGRTFRLNIGGFIGRVLRNDCCLQRLLS